MSSLPCTEQPSSRLPPCGISSSGCRGHRAPQNTEEEPQCHPGQTSLCRSFQASRGKGRCHCPTVDRAILICPVTSGLHPRAPHALWLALSLPTLSGKAHGTAQPRAEEGSQLAWDPEPHNLAIQSPTALALTSHPITSTPGKGMCYTPLLTSSASTSHPSLGPYLLINQGWGISYSNLGCEFKEIYNASISPYPLPTSARQSPNLGP